MVSLRPNALKQLWLSTHLSVLLHRIQQMQLLLLQPPQECRYRSTRQRLAAAAPAASTAALLLCAAGVAGCCRRASGRARRVAAAAWCPLLRCWLCWRRRSLRCGSHCTCRPRRNAHPSAQAAAAAHIADAEQHAIMGSGHSSIGQQKSGQGVLSVEYSKLIPKRSKCIRTGMHQQGGCQARLWHFPAHQHFAVRRSGRCNSSALDPAMLWPVQLNSTARTHHARCNAVNGRSCHCD